MCHADLSQFLFQRSFCQEEAKFFKLAGERQTSFWRENNHERFNSYSY